jgi:hypothetical protein
VADRFSVRYDDRMMRFTIALLLALPTAAQAEEIVCVRSEANVMQVDGMLDDWSDLRGLVRSEGSGGDAGLDVRCTYDDASLYLAIDVADERIIRSKKNEKYEDHLLLTLGGARIELFPALEDKGAKQVARLEGGKALAGVSVADSLQEKGYAFELGFPFAKIPGYTQGAPAVPFAVELRDADMASEHKIETTLATGAGTLAFAEAAAAVKDMLASLRLKPVDLTLDVLANVDGSEGAERVIAGGRVIAILTTGYTYVELPASPADVHEVKVVDLAGKGKSFIVARYTQRAGRGAREVLAVFSLGADGAIGRPFAHEIGKSLGCCSLTNTWELVARKNKKGKTVPGFDLVFKVGEVKGFTEEEWREEPAEDMTPILLPWGEKKSETYVFDGEEVSGG